MAQACNAKIFLSLAETATDAVQRRAALLALPRVWTHSARYTEQRELLTPEYATVILALGAGRRAAAGIEEWLRERAWPPGAEPQDSTPVPEQPACPKCKRPILDEEPYICCADQVLSWQCCDCRKIEEGFAFPYGMCPSCGQTVEISAGVIGR